MIKPQPLTRAVPDDFTVDDHAGTVTCPAGHARAMSRSRTVTFGRQCADSPVARPMHHRQDRSLDDHPRAR